MNNVNFYSDIMMGTWAIPLNIGCLNFSWRLYLDKYDFNQPTKYGAKTVGKYWLYKTIDDKAFFTEDINNIDFFYPQSDDIVNVGKFDCMDLYKRIKEKYLVVKTIKSENIHLVYQDRSKWDSNNDNFLCFTEYNLAKQYADFLIRIPYSTYHTEETIKIKTL